VVNFWHFASNISISNVLSVWKVVRKVITLLSNFKLWNTKYCSFAHKFYILAIIVAFKPAYIFQHFFSHFLYNIIYNLYFQLAIFLIKLSFHNIDELFPYLSIINSIIVIINLHYYILQNFTIRFKSHNWFFKSGSNLLIVILKV